MSVNHNATDRILSALKPLIDLRHVEVSSENTDYFGNPSGSDYVLLEKVNHIGFEVFSDEIRVDFFDDHTHFGGNYTMDSDADTNQYAQDALVLIRRLLTETLVKIETYRGRARIRYEWFFMNADGAKESIGGPWLKPLFTFANPFRKKTYQETRWRYHRESGSFLRLVDDVVSVHSYDWDIMIEITHANHAFAFYLERYTYDAELACFYWTPIEQDGKSLFDTEKKALQAAKDAAKLYCKMHKDRHKEI